jgi:two-component system OmpR family sensor kinase/two-component system sensor histidine kinase BaeS
MIREFCGGGRPPWWPAGEPWPPAARGRALDRRARIRFFRRVALAAVALVIIGLAGILTAAWLIASRIGFGGWPAAVLLVCVAFAALGAMSRAMGRFATPLRALMDAADQVAEGHYAIRVGEHGPPPLRALARSFNTMAERLQSADRVRRDLMADVAHELRTPLAVLQGRLEGLLDGIYPRDDRHLSQLLDETKMLSRLVEDLRTVALSDAGALQLQKEPTPIDALIHDVVRSMQPDADHKGVILNAIVSHVGVIDLDPQRIREVLTNLLSNAIRHTDEGKDVTVSFSATKQVLSVTVTDAGHGMTPDQVSRMFDRFYKGSASSGSGLGLAIARGIVLAHGGDIKASSAVENGTSVTFTLPR